MFTRKQPQHFLNILYGIAKWHLPFGTNLFRLRANKTVLSSLLYSTRRSKLFLCQHRWIAVQTLRHSSLVEICFLSETCIGQLPIASRAHCRKKLSIPTQAGTLSAYIFVSGIYRPNPVGRLPPLADEKILSNWQRHCNYQVVVAACQTKISKSKGMLHALSLMKFTVWRYRRCRSYQAYCIQPILSMPQSI